MSTRRKMDVTTVATIVAYTASYTLSAFYKQPTYPIVPKPCVTTINELISHINNEEYHFLLECVKKITDDSVLCEYVLILEALLEQAKDLQKKNLFFFAGYRNQNTVMALHKDINIYIARLRRRLEWRRLTQ